MIKSSPSFAYTGTTTMQRRPKRSMRARELAHHGSGGAGVRVRPAGGGDGDGKGSSSGSDGGGSGDGSPRVRLGSGHRFPKSKQRQGQKRNAKNKPRQLNRQEAKAGTKVKPATDDGGSKTPSGLSMRKGTTKPQKAGNAPRSISQRERNEEGRQRAWDNRTGGRRTDTRPREGDGDAKRAEQGKGKDKDSANKRPGNRFTKGASLPSIVPSKSARNSARVAVAASAVSDAMRQLLFQSKSPTTQSRIV